MTGKVFSLPEFCATIPRVSLGAVGRRKLKGTG